MFGERSRRRKRRRTESGDEGTEEGDKVSRLERKVSILEARLGGSTDERRDEMARDEREGGSFLFLVMCYTADLRR